ncbi:CRAL-TRIO domain-containing protein [Lentinula edodes]|nr:CRAL-TRIO domain-containing protein [Lentinula edodes]
MSETEATQTADALKAFRVEIPDALASAYPDKNNAKTAAVKFWGVTIEPSNLLDAKVRKTTFIATLRWRDQFNVEAACKEEFPQDMFGQLGHIYGQDKTGRPVVYNVYGGNQDLKAVFGDIQRFFRLRVAFMEKSIELLDFETTDEMIQVHDYAGVSMTSRDTNSKNATSEVSSMFSSHYPELLHKKYFINVSSYMTWIFWLSKPLMPSATLAKMSVVGSGGSTIGKALLTEVNAKQLPIRYGGEAEAF